MNDLGFVLREICQRGWRRSIVALGALALVSAGCSDSDPDGDGGGGGGGPGFSTGDDVRIEVDPSAIVFAAVAIGTSDTRVVTIEHAGQSGTLELQSVTLVTDSADFALTPPALTELASAETTTLELVYTPTDADQDTGTIVIETNAPAAGGTVTVEIPINAAPQVGILTAVPSIVDFGGIEGGVTATETVELVNAGAFPVEIETIGIYGTGVADFAVVDVEAIAMPRTLGPSEILDLQVSYTPTGGNTDEGYLTFEYTDNDGPGQLEVALTGRETGAILSAFPDPVDFGEREPDVTHELTVNLSNAGDNDLVISGIEPAEWSSPTVGVAGFPAEGVTLAQGDVFPLTVTFTPTLDMVPTPAAIAGLVVSSNDSPSGGQYVLQVFGKSEAPSLKVNPPEFVDFAFVAQNLTTLRKVSLFNAGNAAVEVTAIALEDNTTGEYEIQVDESWGPTKSTPEAGVIGPGETQEVRLLFTNNGPDTGTEWAKLRISSNDGTQPEWVLDLKAQRAGSPSCELDLVPAQLNYGVVPRGFTKTMTMKLVNIGSGNCSFHSAFVNDCAGFAGFFGTSCPDPDATVKQNGDSDFYQIVKTPPAIQEGLKPGESYDIEVLFKPPENAPLFGDELTNYAGFLGVRVVDPYDPSGDLTYFPKPNGGGLSPYTPNLLAKSGFADLAVIPGEVDFGLTTIGCYSQTLTVFAYNVGNAPLELTSWELVGCSPEFVMKAFPGLPMTLNPQEGAEFQIVYVPQDEGGDSCSLALTSNDADTPSAAVPISGAGTFDTEHTDVYIQSTGQDVDVLFVVDDSGSMGEEQSNLASNFSQFILEAQTWQNDYHVGVISTDVEASQGQLLGNPRFVTDASSGQFANNVQLGTGGSGTEQGLAAAQQALSLPNIADSTTPCSDDTDCAATGDACYDGFCGGPNRGFMRKDAALEIVFVSDEDDQSASDLSFYETFFKNLKGIYNTNLMHIHAIVGPPGGCSSSNGDASAGMRYIDLANATGGNVVSICEPDFASGLQSIGEIAFGLKVQFFLTRVPDPSTIEVSIDGVDCPAVGGGTNWSYEPGGNSVVFEESGGCMPQAGEEIVIQYDTICLTE